MTDLGAPSSYLALEEGVPVYSSEGEEVGTVALVLADPEKDIFEGLVIGVGGGHRFVEAAKIERIGERGVALTIASSGVAELPEPRERAATVSSKPEDTVDDDLTARLHRAWEALKGDR
jgi:uncharacterized protein YrrD